MTDRPSTLETELKFRLTPEQLPRLLKHRALRAWRAGKPRTERMVSTYFDTPDLKLMKNRVAVRVRHVDGRMIQTVKCAPTDRDGPHVRREWEREVGSERPDLAAFADPVLRKLLLPLGGDNELGPIFVTEIERRTWPLRVKDSTVELAVDVGEIKSPQGRVPVCEAELELKTGAVEGVYELAQELNRALHMVAEPRSKAERGYALATAERPKAQRAEPLELGRNPTLGEAFLRIGRNGLTHLRANEACLRAGRDATGIHQFRVALRRLRSTFSAFRRLIPEAERKRIAEELRWISRRFGRARDWDVFVAELLTPVRERLKDDPALAAFRKAAVAAQTQAWREASAALESSRYTSNMLHVEGWWESGPWARGEGEVWQEPARKFARETLTRLARKLNRLGKRLPELSEVELHEMRIRAKKLRYTAEFFRSLFKGKATRAYLEALAAMQDRLGSLNDAVVTHELLREIEARNPGMDPALLARASGIITGWNSARVTADLKLLPEAWARFAALKPFWK